MIINPLQIVNELFKDKYDYSFGEYYPSCITINVSKKVERGQTGVFLFGGFKYKVMYSIAENRVLYISTSNNQEDLDEVLSILPEGAHIVIR